MSEAVETAVARRWLTGLRREWLLSGALPRWIEDRGISGVVYTPAAYEIDDAGLAMASLVAAGARADESLMWDLAVTDMRGAADALRGVYTGAGTLDGYVVVWIDPARADNADKAVLAAAEIVGEVHRANVAIGMAWTPSRAAVVQALVRNDCPVALSAVRDAAARDAVVTARNAGMDERRKELQKAAAAKDETVDDVPEVPVFLLGSPELGVSSVVGVPLVSEFELFGVGPTARVPLTPDAETTGVNIAKDRLAQRGKLAGRDDAYTPDYFAGATARDCQELTTDEVIEDVWLKDHTIWKPEPDEITNRLGWLDLPERMAGETKDITEWARKARASADISHIVMLGMGGSSLASETFSRVLSGGVSFTVLDTTDPDHIASVRDSLDLERTMFVVGSKSGTTVETRAHLEYFWSLVPRGDRFVCVTDPGTELASVAKERSFNRVFETDPNIGGRYSALTHFGLVPAALAGVDIDVIVNGARRGMSAHSPGVSGLGGPGLRLGAAMGEANGAGRDKLTFVLPPELAALGPWIEQLIAESTGKEGKGMLPVVGEQLGGPEVYGADRLFIAYTLTDELPPQLEALEEHLIVKIRVPDARAIGYEMYRWEMATAILGYELDINPFDQPDVEAAKVRAREALQGAGGERPDAGDAKAALEGIEAPKYIAIQAFIAPNDDNAARLEAVRTKLRNKYSVAVTTGFGPRFLHSTGQYHKGGANNGVFLQVTGPHATDIDVPGMGFSFGKLIDAQADGDLRALRDAGRTAARVSLQELEALA